MSTAADPTIDPSVATIDQVPFSIDELLLPKNHCIMSDCERFLFRRRRYNALAMLYQSNNLWRKALEVWSKMGSGQFKESVPTTSALTPSATSSSSISFSSMAAANASAAASASSSSSTTTTSPSSSSSAHVPRTDGIRETVTLLSQFNHNNWELIHEFAEWVLRADPAEGMKIFTSTSRDDPLPPDKVLRFLKSIRLDPRNNPDAVDFVETYLEHIVRYERNTDPKYHNALAQLYLNKVRTLALPRASTAARSGLIYKAGEEPGMLGRVRSRLLSFLRESESYDCAEILMSIDVSNTTLYDELIILYRKLGEHRQALTVCVELLQDHNRAVQYCMDIPVDPLAATATAVNTTTTGSSGRSKNNSNSNDDVERKSQSTNLHNAANAAAASSDAAEAESNRKALNLDRTTRSDAFCYLLELYFSSGLRAVRRRQQQQRNDGGDASDNNFNSSSIAHPAASMDFGDELQSERSNKDRLLDMRRGVFVLNNYSVHIDPVKALKIVPSDIPVAAISAYLEKVIPFLLHKRRDAQILKGLARVENLQARSRLSVAQSRRVLVRPDMRCPVCNQKIVADVIVSVHPENPRPMHYKCIRNFSSSERSQQQQRRQRQGSQQATVTFL
eukprot:TRINITY_DN65915_c5_g3_i1.p1 TRINITY_DN65915_c5_g3~~TRINITY_DN65915_c5_g3_i1.p1  ORF type:complete len:676 (-),score=338.33 TRINITY_DN65915_c5_g3_i1:28-1884(-)